MKPYGNEHKWVVDDMNSSKTGQPASKNKTMSRRLHKKTRRAKDKAALRNEIKGADVPPSL